MHNNAYILGHMHFFLFLQHFLKLLYLARALMDYLKIWSTIRPY